MKGKLSFKELGVAIAVNEIKTNEDAGEALLCEGEGQRAFRGNV